MPKSIMCRLAYLITPKPELLQTVRVLPKNDDVSRPTTVISPSGNYEETFEGWKQAWMAKAKSDFIAGFVESWSDDLPEFIAKLDGPGCFDRWWTISEIEAIEIDPAWKPFLETQPS